MGELARRWFRVSSGSQKEESQFPDVIRWTDARDYVIADTDIVLHDISASAGEQEAAQEMVISDIKAGRYKVLVAWTGDRVERRGSEALLRFIRRVKEAGGRLECSNDPLVNSAATLGELGPALAGWIARYETERKKDRIRIAHEAIEANRAFRGKRPFGYAIAGGKHAKHLVVHITESDLVRRGMQMAIDGYSLTEVGRLWGKSADTVGKILRKPLYWTGRYEVRRKDGGVYVHYCEPLVPYAMYEAACAAMASRNGNRDYSVRAMRGTDLSGAVVCGRCGGVLYRLKRVNSEGNTYVYYRCRIPAAKREQKTVVSCGNSVLASACDAALDEIFASSVYPEIWSVWEAGSDTAAQLARVQEELDRLPSRRLSDDEEDAERARLRKERKELENTDDTPGGWRHKFTGRTEGDAWRAKSIPERVKWLRSEEITVRVRRDVFGPLLDTEQRINGLVIGVERSELPVFVQRALAVHVDGVLALAQVPPDPQLRFERFPPLREHVFPGEFLVDLAIGHLTDSHGSSSRPLSLA